MKKETLQNLERIQYLTFALLAIGLFAFLYAPNLSFGWILASVAGVAHLIIKVILDEEKIKNKY